MIEIEICERLMDYWIDDEGQRRPKYHAQVKNEPHIWACARNTVDAIGQLIRKHPDRFGIEITYLEGKLPR